MNEKLNVAYPYQGPSVHICYHVDEPEQLLCYVIEARKNTC